MAMRLSSPALALVTGVLAAVMAQVQAITTRPEPMADPALNLPENRPTLDDTLLENLCKTPRGPCSGPTTSRRNS